MAIAFTLLFLTLHLMAIRNEILRRRIARLTMIAAAEGDSLCARLTPRVAPHDGDRRISASSSRPTRSRR